MTDRLLLFGIDSATLNLIQPWVDRGDLPALGRLMRAGASGALRSVPNMITPAAWTTFATGCNPGRHGIFYFTERVQGSYTERFVKGASRAFPPFWVLLSEAGLRCAVINVPMTYPADPVQGVMVSGMDAPSLDAPGFTHPEDLAADLRERFSDLLGPGSLSGAIGHLMLSGKLDEAVGLLERRVEARTALAQYLMERFPVDLFALVHMEVDAVQHYFWKHIDPRVPSHSPAEARRHGDSILRLYRKVDASLETLQAAYGPAKAVVMSDHGAGASPGVEDGVPWIRLVLEEMGLATPRTEQDALRRTSTSAAAVLYRALNPRLPRTARSMIRRWIPSAKAVAKASIKYQYDWSRTRAFCMGAAGSVWLNVRGREPEGIVEPGAEYEDVRETIRRTFMALRDARTGEAIVEGVFFREDIYQGPFLERAPDLLVRFRDVVIGEVLMDGKVLRLPQRSAATPKQVKTGSHRPDGILILGGRGTRDGATLSGARLDDVAPTILYWMERPVPSYMDGRVLTDAFTPEHLAIHPPRSVTRDVEVGARDGSAYTREEADLVMERLKDLGYM